MPEAEIDGVPFNTYQFENEIFSTDTFENAVRTDLGLKLISRADDEKTDGFFDSANGLTIIYLLKPLDDGTVDKLRAIISGKELE